MTVDVPISPGGGVGGLDDRATFLLLRRSAGLSQGDVAAAVGVYQPYISRWERGVDGGSGLTEDRLRAAWDVVLGASTRVKTEGAA